MNEETIRRIFAEVRSELYFPPCELQITHDNKESPFFITGSKIYISPESIPNGVDKEEYLRSVMRHEVAHLHYCPYDVRTAYELIKEAYDSCRNWDIAYFSFLLFSDLSVDCFYLLNRFGEIPYHVNYFVKSRFGINRYIQESYRHLLGIEHKEGNFEVENVARQLSMVMKSERNWFSKIRLLALILAKNKVRVKIPKRIFGVRGTIPLREDLSKDSIERISQVLGGIKNAEEAKKFYEYWIKPRLRGSEMDEIRLRIKKMVRKSKVESKLKKDKSPRGKAVSQVDLKIGEEPELPTSLSKPFGELSEKMIEDTLWRVFWYRARAKRTIMLYLEEGRIPEPSLSITTYPTDWNIEDEVEDLDIESSLDEGRLRVEINTVKWESKIMGKGSSMIIARVPSSLIVLDASKSMQYIFDDAATSAFINLLSVERIGGSTATITFSTEYYYADWHDSTLEKEIALALYFGKMTIIPLNKIIEVISGIENRVLINIITDCGWQNIEEALPILSSIVKSGHTIKIFYLRGGEYPERLKRVSMISGVKIIPVKDPERDLHYLVIKETTEEYGSRVMSLKESVSDSLK
ncbi:MAG: hypothetical protein QXS51_02385 [Thermoproteota archaeon]|nr:hypothetical protein [Candidatus Brockarchaeota archaeon]